jgi:hypothetical protein
VWANGLIDLASQSAIKPGHDIAEARLASARHAPRVPAGTVRQPETFGLPEGGRSP